MFGSGLVVVVFCLIVGDWNRPMAWALGAVYILTFAVQAVLLIPRSPALLAERAVRMRKGTKTWDKVLLPFYGLVTLAILAVAALDIRNDWGMAMPLWLQVCGVTLALAANTLVTWSMLANAYFAFSVRLQQDRRQSVVTTGPYRILRHPGYLGAILLAPGMAVALGSVWALIPASLSVVLLVLRTALEDRTLHVELAGYPDYARRTRFRLLPGVW